MPFVSIVFLACFFPIVFLLYSLFRPITVKNAILLVGSLIFYAYYDVKYLAFLFFAILVTFCAGLIVEKNRNNMILSKVTVVIALVLNMSMLAVCKYSEFVTTNINSILMRMGHEDSLLHLPEILLPVGLSFIVFQSSTYLFDLQRGDVKAEKSILNYALFVSFFPVITSGPILRSKAFLPQIRTREGINFQQFQCCVVRFLWGVFLKMVIADRLAIFTDTVYSNLSGYSGFVLLVCAMVYSIQIYADFSGYSHMAIAIVQMFGFSVPENFREPYLALNFQDFWRRWHISLTSWFTDYLYIPLGGSRRGTFRKYLNIFIVFLVSGLWHGASWSFVIWGGIHAVYQIVGQITRKSRERLADRWGIQRQTVGWRVWQRLFVFILSTFAWIFFRAGTFDQSILFLKSLFSTANPWVLFDGTLLTLGMTLADWQIAFVAMEVLLAVSHCRAFNKSEYALINQSSWIRVAIMEMLLLSVVVFGIYGEGYSASAFIYAGF
ncbi:MAG: MBOAT family O-acyltransferase [Eubacteriales bacterium]|nr:MBOAT family O-acyltransferase [Eubacteriales bacterium]